MGIGVYRMDEELIRITAYSEIILFETAARKLKRLEPFPCPPPSGSGPKWTSSAPE